MLGFILRVMVLRFLATSFLIIFCTAAFSQQIRQKLRPQSSGDAAHYQPQFQGSFSIELQKKIVLQTKGMHRCSYLVLSNLARAAESISDNEAFDCINSYLALREENRTRLETLFESEIAITEGSAKLIITDNPCVKSRAFMAFSL
jgi:hypothetical protein